jgi:hypothetical protein
MGLRMDLFGKHFVKILGQIGYYVVLTCKVTSGTRIIVPEMLMDLEVVIIAEKSENSPAYIHL